MMRRRETAEKIVAKLLNIQNQIESLHRHCFPIDLDHPCWTLLTMAFFQKTRDYHCRHDHHQALWLSALVVVFALTFA
jgi:hypothetical protein